MTQPEKEFESGFRKFHEAKVWFTRSAKYPHMGIIELAHGIPGYNAGIYRVDLSELTEWNPDPKPKSFEEEREALANDVVVLAENNRQGKDAVYMSMAKMLDIAARIRAIQPDAPAAAVAGSAEPVGYWRKLVSFNREPEFLSPGRWEELEKHQQGEYAPVYLGRYTMVDQLRSLAPPSPPTPNPVGVVAWMVKITDGRGLGDSFFLVADDVWSAKKDADKHAAGLAELKVTTEVLPLCIASAAVSAPFDEAAERKLFEEPK